MLTFDSNVMRIRMCDHPARTVHCLPSMVLVALRCQHPVRATAVAPQLPRQQAPGSASTRTPRRSQNEQASEAGSELGLNFALFLCCCFGWDACRSGTVSANRLLLLFGHTTSKSKQSGTLLQNMRVGRMRASVHQTRGWLGAWLGAPNAGGCVLGWVLRSAS